MAKTTQTVTLPDGSEVSRVSSMSAEFAVAVAELDGTEWEVGRWSKSHALAEKFAATVTAGYPVRILPVVTS